MTSSPSSWDSPPKTLVLPNNAVHVWRASLHVSASYLHTLEDTLAADERARAERFHFQKHREHFIAGTWAAAEYLEPLSGQGTRSAALLL